ncbi:hypothetical protein LK435_19985 [Bordetella parapertussis]|nr:hypothetical protein [Bordetella parapertussis]UEB03072.1 hypothetical protein LK409_11875 [Bordetella parapertussis]UEB16471.1 hypothetical protein LK435_19985 [Bordetella parapertussis]WNY38479.1 hypothetical protein ROL27_22300 [Bordetella parapertussis]BDC27393.1 hypothetical protein NB2BOR_A16840 [Bordetella parapertussis]
MPLSRRASRRQARQCQGSPARRRARSRHRPWRHQGQPSQSASKASAPPAAQASQAAGSTQRKPWRSRARSSVSENGGATAGAAATAKVRPGSACWRGCPPAPSRQASVTAGRLSSPACSAT